MSETSRSNSRAGLWIAILLAFAIGFFVGLVLFGWNLTPVVWTNGGFSTLGENAKTDFLRAAIDSHAYRADDLEALRRYNSLGDNKAEILASVGANPGGLNPQDIEAFAASVGASQALTNPPPESGTAEEPAEGQETAPAQGLSGWLRNPLLLAGSICGVLVVAVLIAIVLIAMNRGRQSPAVAGAPISPVPGEPAASTPTVETSQPAGEQIPDWLQPKEEEDPFQTVRLEEASLAQVFETEDEVDLAATPPRGLHLGDVPAGGEAAPAAEMPEELTDEDLADLSAQDFSTRMPQPGTTAYIDESMVADEATDLTQEDRSWLEGAPEAELNEAAWMESPAAAEEATVDEPAPEEMAPFELDAPSFTAPPAESAETGLAEDELGVDSFDLNPPIDLEEVEVEETPEETYAKFSQDIAYISGVSEDEASRLRSIGITVPLLLLKKGANPDGRQQIAEQAEIDTGRLLKWVNDVDLFRVKGIDQEFATLLEAAGVETIDDLAMSNPKELYQRLREVSPAVPGLHRLPTHGTVEGWISQAKKLPRSVSY